MQLGDNVTKATLCVLISVIFHQNVAHSLLILHYDKVYVDVIVIYLRFHCHLAISVFLLKKLLRCSIIYSCNTQSLFSGCSLC